MAVSDTTHEEGSEASGPRRQLPYQALYAIAAVFVAISVVLVVFAVRDTSAGPSTIPPVTTPSAGTPTSGPTATPSPTPTSPEDKAVADAVAAIVAYHRATNQLGHDGGKKATEARVLKLTTEDGPERKFVKIYSKDIRNRELRSTGWSKVSTRVNAVELGEKPPRVDLTVCLDQIDVKASEAGKSIKPPRYLLYAASLHLRGGRWLVDSESNMTADLDPMPVTECGL